MKTRTNGILQNLVSYVLCAAIATCGAMSAQSQTANAVAPKSSVVPNLVKFSGTVGDPRSKALSGAIGLTFALYRDQQGGAPLWLETQNVTVDRSGHYSASLGSTKTEGVPTQLFTSGEARWLRGASRGTGGAAASPADERALRSESSGRGDARRPAGFRFYGGPNSGFRRRCWPTVRHDYRQWHGKLRPPFHGYNNHRKLKDLSDCRRKCWHCDYYPRIQARREGHRRFSRHPDVVSEIHSSDAIGSRHRIRCQQYRRRELCFGPDFSRHRHDHGRDRWRGPNRRRHYRQRDCKSRHHQGPVVVVSQHFQCWPNCKRQPDAQR